MIDLADPNTYGSEITAHLDAGRQLLTDYYQVEQQRDDRYDRGVVHVREPNPFFREMDAWRDALAERCHGCDLLAYHYSRMTDAEVQRVGEHGFQPTSLALLRSRLDHLVNEGQIDAPLADRIYASSPLQSELYGSRLDMFWLTAPATPVMSGGVRLLLGTWGGEAAYWCLDEADGQVLNAIGMPRVFVISLPIAWDRHGGGWKVANYLVASLAQTLGFDVTPSRYDFSIARPIKPEQILSVISEGDGAFDLLGR